MRILITGANGFIGKNLVEYFNGKYNIVFPGRKTLDLLNEEEVECYLKKGRFDVVIHSANTNNTRKKETTKYESLDGNLRMFFNLERCKKYYGKMYYFGSGAEYGMNYYIPKMSESYFGIHTPKDPYGFSKYIMSRTCDQSSNIYDLRLFGVFGKYEEWERRFISNAICRALTGKDITIQQNVYFDYLWIDDLCAIVHWFIEHTPQHKHYNVCRGNRIDLYSLACMVRKALGADCDITIKQTGWKSEYTGNNERLIEEIGHYQFIDYEEAIMQLCNYYKTNIDLIEPEKLLG